MVFDVNNEGSTGKPFVDTDVHQVSGHVPEAAHASLKKLFEKQKRRKMLLMGCLLKQNTRTAFF